MWHDVDDESKDQKQQQASKLDEIAIALPPIAEAIQDGSMDEELSAAISEQFGVSKTKSRSMLKELRKDGETTVPVVRRVINRPRIKALAPDEDIFWPNYTIDPQEAPYVFHVLNMTPEQIRSKIASEGWDEEFVDKAIENATIGENDVYTNNLSLEDEILRDDDETIRIVYCYQRLLDEDNIPGIYCTVFCNEVPDLYAKHTLMDYAHGGYPFVVSTLAKP